MNNEFLVNLHKKVRSKSQCIFSKCIKEMDLVITLPHEDENQNLFICEFLYFSFIFDRKIKYC